MNHCKSYDNIYHHNFTDNKNNIKAIKAKHDETNSV